MVMEGLSEITIMEVGRYLESRPLFLKLKLQKMTPEELLKTRYKVIADYPGQCFEKGEIIQGDVAYLISGEGWSKKDRMVDYPALFKKLEWWEGREPEEMPDWIKDGDKIYRTKDWKIIGNAMTVKIMIDFKLTQVNINVCRRYLPSSEKEYNEKLSRYTL
jgi:hypothetical protein